MVKAFLRAPLSHFGKNFKSREALKNVSCLSVASFRILAERNLKSEMARLSEQNMLWPYEISKYADPVLCNCLYLKLGLFYDIMLLKTINSIT
jgi:hypothetical protein